MPIYLFLVFVIIHFLGDWIAQPREIAENKSKHWWALKSHILDLSFWMYFAFGIETYVSANIGHRPVFHSEWVAVSWAIGIIVIKTTLYSIIHGIQDWFLYRIAWLFKKVKFNPETITAEQRLSIYKESWLWNTIAIDQTLHFCEMFGVVYFVNKLMGIW